ncbi:MAG: DUF2254 domain-containing protein [Pseudobdellovibrionaceae bacterium]|nr:DUF2254 domain-containing protein [Pseudobdellovibrionaceae bacterium]
MPIDKTASGLGLSKPLFVLFGKRPVAGSIVTVAGVTFSISIVILSLASQQYALLHHHTPMVLNGLKSMLDSLKANAGNSEILNHMHKFRRQISETLNKEFAGDRPG